MEEILAFIEKKKLEFSQLPFFEYLRDQNISPRQRLAFAPCAAPFIMSFGELNRTVFRDEPTNDPIQKIINQHTYEDDHHWLWFLEDLEKIGLNPSEPFTKTLNFLWSEETKASRRVAYELYNLTIEATAIQKLVAIECVEATGNVFLECSSKLVRELQSFSEIKEFRFFGASHLIVDTGHTYCSPKAQQIVESVHLSKDLKKENLELIEHIFEVFTNFVDELLEYSKVHRFDQVISKLEHQHTQTFKPIGSYLLEAGLVNSEQLDKALKQQKSTPMPIGKILSNQGLVKQQTIEYLMEKVVSLERNFLDTGNASCAIQRQSEESNNDNLSSSISKHLGSPMRLGGYLVEAALVSTEQIQEALKEQKNSNIPIGQILSNKGFVRQETIEYLMEKFISTEQKATVLN
jgi:hypothetical protein